MKTLIFVLFLTLISDGVSASTCSSAPAGTQHLFGSSLFYCDGSAWITMGDGNPTGSLCVDRGKQKYDMDSVIGTKGMLYCDGSGWISLTTGNSPDMAFCLQPGTQRNANSSMEYCNDAGAWKDMKTSFAAAIISCSSIGAQGACDATNECYWDGSGCSSCPCKH